jgi:small nuclear ribonucleoprotein (snRNP)-like protein
LVERVFAELTKRCLKRGSFQSVDNGTNAVLDYLEHRNVDSVAVCVRQNREGRGSRRMMIFTQRS